MYEDKPHQQGRFQSPSSPRRMTRKNYSGLIFAAVAALLIITVQYSVRQKGPKWDGSGGLKEKYFFQVGLAPNVTPVEQDQYATYSSDDMIVGTVKHPENVTKTEEEKEDENTMWRGFHSLETMFIFGDSYSDTYFNQLGEQPSDEQPMGNHGDGEVSFIQHTRWPVPLTTKYNDSVIHTYNFAKCGAVVSREVIKMKGSVGSTVIEQIDDLYRPTYVDYDMETSSWQPNTTLFVIFVGVNDNIRLHETSWGVTPSDQPRVLHQHQRAMQKLYDTGARNFLIMNLPPVDRYPFSTHLTNLSTTVTTWNRALASYAQEFRTLYPYSTVLEYDVHAFVTSLMANPTIFPQTSNIKNTTEQCGAYGGEPNALKNGLTEESWDKERCPFPLKEYLFIDALHLTHPVHDALAMDVARMMREYRVPRMEGEGWKEREERERRKKVEEEKARPGLPRIGG